MIELERSGVAALHIEDQPFPNRSHYHFGKGRLASTVEVAAKLRAAVAARRDPDLLLIARSDALRVTRSLEETAARCAAYLEAGADMLMVLDLEPESVYAPETYERAVQHVQELYRSEGFLAAQVGPVQVIRRRCDPRSPPGECRPIPIPDAPSDVCTYDAERPVGFVYLAWDGGVHAFVLDTMVASRARHGFAPRMANFVTTPCHGG